MIKACRKCGIRFIAKLSSETSHKKCPPRAWYQKKGKWAHTHRIVRPKKIITEGERRNSYYQKKYGISLETFNQMMQAQDSRCAICGAVLERLFVDHSHVTGKIRGLLCDLCNSGLGHFRDSVGVMEAAIRYLKEKG